MREPDTEAPKISRNMAEWISHRRLNGPDGHTPVLAALLTSAVVEESHHENLRPQLCSLFAGSTYMITPRQKRQLVSHKMMTRLISKKSGP